MYSVPYVHPVQMVVVPVVFGKAAVVLLAMAGMAIAAYGVLSLMGRAFGLDDFTDM